MNTIQLNNQRHEEALSLVKQFEKQGGKVKRICSTVSGDLWEPPRPRHQQKKK